jgi:hypothetical protein
MYISNVTNLLMYSKRVKLLATNMGPLVVVLGTPLWRTHGHFGNIMRTWATNIRKLGLHWEHQKVYKYYGNMIKRNDEHENNNCGEAPTELMLGFIPITYLGKD